MAETNLKIAVVLRQQRTYLVFVPDQNVEEDGVEYSTVIDWAISNLEKDDVWVLTQDEVSWLEYQTGLLEIINIDNESMILDGEDTWVGNQNVKASILRKLKECKSVFLEPRTLKLTSKMIELVELSLAKGKPLHFLF